MLEILEISENFEKFQFFPNFKNCSKFFKCSKFFNFKIFKFQNFKKYSEIRGATSISDAFISFPILGVLDVSKSIVKLGGFAVAANKL